MTHPSQGFLFGWRPSDDAEFIAMCLTVFAFVGLLVGFGISTVQPATNEVTVYKDQSSLIAEPLWLTGTDGWVLQWEVPAKGKTPVTGFVRAGKRLSNAAP